MLDDSEQFPSPLIHQITKEELAKLLQHLVLDNQTVTPIHPVRCTNCVVVFYGKFVLLTILEHL